jgi:flagellar hook-associated protein 1
MSTLFSSIHHAYRALMAHQTAIQVIEHNVANANTPGYRRQEAILTAGPGYLPPNMLRAALWGQTGGGVYVEQVRRYNLAFFDGRLRAEFGEARRWEAQRDALRQLEVGLSETSGDGLTTQLDAFWAGWQSLSADPTNMAIRTELLHRAQTLAQGLNGRSSKLEALRINQNEAIVQQVELVNRLAQQVAGLNVEISNVLAVGQQPNDLLDQRDRILDQLAEVSGAVSSVQEDGGVLVSIGGHALVVANTAFSLVTTQDPGNNNLARVSWEDGLAYKPPQGELRGLLEVRDLAIPAQLQGLNDLAAMLVQQTNDLHRTGYGLDNSTGLDFFEGNDAHSIRVNAALENIESIASAGSPDSPGDGSLASRMAELGGALLLGNGTLSLTQFYNNQVTSLGLDIRQVSNDAGARRLVASSLEAQRESATGVSLDEEAANLVKSQRAYEAAARLMTALDDMVNRIINGMGRVGL